MKIKDKLNKIRKKYKRIAKDKFMYNTSGDLRKKRKRVVCYYVVYNKDRGYSLMRFVWKRGQAFDRKWWSQNVKERTKTTFVEKVLPAIEAKHGDKWVLKDFIGWTWDE